MPKVNTNKKIEQYVSLGLINAELHRFFSKEFESEGFCHMEVLHHRTPVQITVTVLKPYEVIGESKQRINCIRALLMDRFAEFKKGLEIVIEMVKEKNLNPKVQCDYIKSKLSENIPFRRAVNAVFKAVMGAGAQGVTVIVSGKLKGQRAKSVKSQQGLVIHSGDSARQYVKKALSVIRLKQGVIGIKVKIMLPYDPNGVVGCSSVISDKIKILEPSEL